MIVGKLVDRGYLLQFIEKTCIIKDKHGKLIGTSTRTRGSIFQLNPTKMTCLVEKVDYSCLWHKTFCHINFDNNVKISTTHVVRDHLRLWSLLTWFVKNV